jgi:hypothetical protein
MYAHFAINQEFQIPAVKFDILSFNLLQLGFWTLGVDLTPGEIHRAPLPAFRFRRSGKAQN